MSSDREQTGAPPSNPPPADRAGLALTITLDVAGGLIRFEWVDPTQNTLVAHGQLTAIGLPGPLHVLAWEATHGIMPHRDGCGTHASSTRALLKRIRRHLPEPGEPPRFGVVVPEDLGPACAGRWHEIHPSWNEDAWKFVDREIRFFAERIDAVLRSGEADAARAGRRAAEFVAHMLLGAGPPESITFAHARPHWLRVTLDQVDECAKFVWSDPRTRVITGTGTVRFHPPAGLRWMLECEGGSADSTSGGDPQAAAAALNAWFERFPTDAHGITVLWKRRPRDGGEPTWEQEPPFASGESPAQWLLHQLVQMAETLRWRHSPEGRRAVQFEAQMRADQERHVQRMIRKERARAEEQERRRARIAQALAERREREQRHAAEAAAAAKKAARERSTPAAPATPPPAPREAPPPVPVKIAAPELVLQETAFVLSSLDSYRLREEAAVWWVSNQSDDLLCLPHCRIERLEYQVRAALRVLGALRGRALLSDEVGLGKTIEAGLVIKELLTRGLVKRFLVLTLPSLVDQWEEELSDKFGLSAATTNQPAARADASAFWRENHAVVASLHTLKQPAHLAIARDVHWDLLVVDEAHHLRNRESQAWQAVNVLPRQFLLLLTATPVQNSLEELYNLVTLLKPGQLPSPKEFRARFIDPARPRQPREPEELRRLLGQVMIRNTRANAGITLPPRRAETALFEPDADELAFWRAWEEELRAALAPLPAAQASLWGRLLLQAAGSSPSAWHTALDKFPAVDRAATWRACAPLASSWTRRVNLLEPLARREGGVVVFTQFLATQAAVAGALREAGVPAFVINGGTPAPERQPITDEFHRRGGALVLTQSGTEGRNLQFCHQLANFDLPWNPMEIEQRIGRLHRLGQQHPVRILNFVQAGTLQEHLLQVLQEKLNLFELVVGETGLVLGDRFSGDELEEEIFRRWRDHAADVGAALAQLGDELAAARAGYDEVKQLDDTLFAHDYESS
ncbi:MAG: DEAD/DEAH box helicase [Opitutaceae bacterium]